MFSSAPVEDVIIEPYGPIFNGPGAEKTDEPFILRKPTNSQLDAIERAKKYAHAQNVKQLLIKQTQQNQSLLMNAARRNQTIALLNRIYIGSIAYDVREDMIKQAFMPFGPVKNVTMSWDPATLKHKGFAFVEFEYPEAAQLAIEQMNGTNYAGRILKVGRPSNLPDATHFMNELIEEFKLQKRIYVSGIHSELTEADIECVFQAFGEIKMCRLLSDPLNPGSHRGFGYVEFENESSAVAAVTSMNRFDLGGQLLRVTKAISPPDGINPNPVINHLPAATAVAAASVTAKLLSMGLEQAPETQSVIAADSTAVKTRSRSSSRSHSRRRSSRHRRYSRRRSSRHRRRRRSSDSKSRSSSASSSSTKRRRRHSRHRRKESRSPSRRRDDRKDKSKRKRSSRSDSHSSRQDGDGRSSRGESVNEGSNTANPSVNPNSNWLTVTLEEEQATTSCAIRSNDSRLYNIPSPSAIPLPPTDSSN